MKTDMPTKQFRRKNIWSNYLQEKKREEESRGREKERKGGNSKQSHGSE